MKVAFISMTRDNMKYNIDNNIGGKTMKKNIFVSGITLMTMLLAVGCSNSANQSSTNNEAKSSKTSHKKSHKAKKHTTKKDKTDVDTDDSETTNSDKKNDKSSESSSNTNGKKTNKNESTNSNNSSDSTGSNNSNNASNSAASNNQTNGKSQNASSANNASDAMFNKMVSDTIKEHGYSSSYGPDNFTLIDGGNGQYSLAEKSTGTIVGHYSVKNGELYKRDILTGNDVKVK